MNTADLPTSLPCPKSAAAAAAPPPPPPSRGPNPARCLLRRPFKVIRSLVRFSLSLPDAYSHTLNWYRHRRRCDCRQGAPVLDPGDPHVWYDQISSAHLALVARLGRDFHRQLEPRALDACPHCTESERQSAAQQLDARVHADLQVALEGALRRSRRRRFDHMRPVPHAVVAVTLRAPASLCPHSSVELL